MKPSSVAACLFACGALACDTSPSTSGERTPTRLRSSAATPASQAKHDVEDSPAIVFLGDSLTAGHGLSESQALPAQVQKRIAAAGLNYRVINAGRSGDTSAGGLARLDWYFRDSVDLAALVVGLGSNDAMRGLSLEALEQNLREIVRRTHQRKPAAKVFLWSLQTFPNLGPEYTSAYAAIFPRVAASENATLLPFPLAGVAANPELNQEDGIHPNARGTEMVADRIWQALEPALGTSAVAPQGSRSTP